MGRVYLRVMGDAGRSWISHLRKGQQRNYPRFSIFHRCMKYEQSATLYLLLGSGRQDILQGRVTRSFTLIHTTSKNYETKLINDFTLMNDKIKPLSKQERHNKAFLNLRKRKTDSIIWLSARMYFSHFNPLHTME